MRVRRRAGARPRTAYVLYVQSLGAVVGDQVEAPVQLIERHGLCQVNAVVQDVHHVAVAGRIPRVVDGVLTEADVDAALPQLLHPGQATALGIAVLTTLQIGVLGRQGDEIQQIGRASGRERVCRYG